MTETELVKGCWRLLFIGHEAAGYKCQITQKAVIRQNITMLTQWSNIRDNNLLLREQ